LTDSQNQIVIKIKKGNDDTHSFIPFSKLELLWKTTNAILVQSPGRQLLPSDTTCTCRISTLPKLFKLLGLRSHTQQRIFVRVCCVLCKWYLQ